MIYDLGIIGGGPAGYTAAAKAIQAGLNVVLFEENALGGTCLHVGCIPTKTLLYSAKQYASAVHAAKYGVVADAVRFDWSKMQQRKTKVVRKLVAGIRQKLNNDHCTIVSGRAVVLSRTDEQVLVCCQDTEFQMRNLMLCTGSVHFVPSIKGVQDNPSVWSSTDALSADSLPESVVIIGGGVIGLEFLTLYTALGVRVSLVEAMPTILPGIDQDIATMLLEKLKKQGADIHLSTKIIEIQGNKVITEGSVLEADKILVCVGRRASLDGLEHLEGLEMDRGGIKVNEFMQTSLRNIYAAGDVTGKMMLAHVAMRQAEVAVGRMLKQIPLQRIAYNAIPSVVYTNPEIAVVGLTEAEVCRFYMDMEGKSAEEVAGLYIVKKIPMTFSGRFVAENEGETGLCKVIIDQRNQTILGVHCIGNPCSEFIAAASFAVRMGYTLAEFQQVVFPHPTVSEVLREVML